LDRFFLLSLLYGLNLCLYDRFRSYWFDVVFIFPFFEVLSSEVVPDVVSEFSDVIVSRIILCDFSVDSPNIRDNTESEQKPEYVF
jgi:hypothetical protein